MHVLIFFFNRGFKAFSQRLHLDCALFPTCWRVNRTDENRASATPSACLLYFYSDSHAYVHIYIYTYICYIYIYIYACTGKKCPSIFSSWLGELQSSISPQRLKIRTSFCKNLKAGGVRNLPYQGEGPIRKIFFWVYKNVKKSAEKRSAQHAWKVYYPMMSQDAGRRGACFFGAFECIRVH